MARLVLLVAHNGREPGETVEFPGGVASAMVLNRIARLATPPEPALSEEAEVSEAPKPSRRRK